MGSRVELFEQIRRDHDNEGLSIRALAERHGVHRRTVRAALESPLPAPRKRPEGRPAPALGPYRALIDGWLEADRKAPRKQRHTARRVWRRLVDEHGARVAERTVREYVAARRRELGEPGEVFVPQIHQAGMEAEVDWGEAQVVLAGRQVTVQLFYLRPCFSGAAFCMAFRRCTQQAFLEGHVQAFDRFGGTFALVRYDNLRSAVKLVLRGRRREETDRFIALRSHYLYESSFTRRARRARTRRAASRARSGAFVATTWSRSPRSPTWPSSTRSSALAARPTWSARSSGDPRPSARRWPGSGRCFGRCRPSRSTAPSRRRSGSTARRW